MKNIKNVGLSLVLFLGLSQSFAAAGELSDISNNAGTVTNPLSESLCDFKAENPQFNYGIASIAELYHKEIDIDDYYAPIEYHPFVRKYPFLRKALFASEMLAEGVCGLLHGKVIQQIKLANYLSKEIHNTGATLQSISKKQLSSISKKQLHSGFKGKYFNNTKGKYSLKAEICPPDNFDNYNACEACCREAQKEGKNEHYNCEQKCKAANYPSSDSKEAPCGGSCETDYINCFSKLLLKEDQADMEPVEVLKLISGNCNTDYYYCLEKCEEKKPEFKTFSPSKACTPDKDPDACNDCCEKNFDDCDQFYTPVNNSENRDIVRSAIAITSICFPAYEECNTSCNAAPEETPSAVPEETPSAVPEETPSAVPEESPSAVPEESPSAVPEKSPSASFSPSPSPEEDSLISSGKKGSISSFYPASAFAVYTIRTALNLVNNILVKPTKPFELFLMDMEQLDSESLQQIYEAVNNIRKIDINPILTVSKQLIKSAGSQDLPEESLLKIERLKTLVNKVDTEPKIKKIATYAFQTVSFSLGLACLSRNPIVALCSSFVDPMVQYVRARINSDQDNFQRYIALSEMVYICDDLIGGSEPLSIES